MKNQSDQSNSPYNVGDTQVYSLHLIGQLGCSIFHNGTSNLKRLYAGDELAVGFKSDPTCNEEVSTMLPNSQFVWLAQTGTV